MKRISLFICVILMVLIAVSCSKNQEIDEPVNQGALNVSKLVVEGVRDDDTTARRTNLKPHLMVFGQPDDKYKYYLNLGVQETGGVSLTINSVDIQLMKNDKVSRTTTVAGNLFFVFKKRPIAKIIPPSYLPIKLLETLSYFFLISQST